MLGGNLLTSIMNEFAAVRNSTAAGLQLHIHSAHYPVSVHTHTADYSHNQNNC
jgi:hypothetical protein